MFTNGRFCTAAKTDLRRAIYRLVRKAFRLLHAYTRKITMMKLTTLYPIQKFRHYGQPFSSSKSAKLLFYGMNYCWFLLLE